MNASTPALWIPGHTLGALHLLAESFIRDCASESDVASAPLFSSEKLQLTWSALEPKHQLRILEALQSEAEDAARCEECSGGCQYCTDGFALDVVKVTDAVYVRDADGAPVLASTMKEVA